MKNLFSLVFLVISNFGLAQTTIFDIPGGGTLPTGWVGNNNIAALPINQTGYFLLEAGTNSDNIVTDIYNLTSYESVVFTVNVAFNGTSGTIFPSKIEISYDGGISYTQLNITPSPASATIYLSSGPITLAGTLTTNIKLKISNNGTAAGRGVKLQAIKLIGYAKSWKLNGNAQTLPGTNFIGTTDAQSLVFKTNNIQSGKIDATIANISFGQYSLANATSGNNNIAIGLTALGANISSHNNVAIGSGSLTKTIVNGDGGNVGIGYQAMYWNTLGTYNSAVGYHAIVNNTTGNKNVSLGFFSGRNNTTGSQNSFIGYNTGLGITTGNYNTILGANVTGLANALSNNIIIADGEGNRRINVDNNGNVGIGTIAPQTKLEITHGTPGNSGLRFTNLTSSDAVTVSSGKVLSVNANGDVILEVAGGGSITDGSETKVTAGTNVTVNGNGTIATPYIINATATNNYWNPSSLDANSIINSNTGSVILGSDITTLPIGYKLYVADGILTEKIKVTLKTSANWADYVFRRDYKLKPLADLEKFIELNKHLPGVKSAKTLVKEGGIDIAQTLAK
jgi:hypothetical protein